MAEIVITPHLLLTYQLVDDYVARRAPLRQAHVDLVAQHRRPGAMFVIGGAVGDPPTQAMLVFRADRATVEAFVARDPYVQEGLVTSWDIQPWAAVLGESLDPATV